MSVVYKPGVQKKGRSKEKKRCEMKRKRIVVTFYFQRIEKVFIQMDASALEKVLALKET